MYFVLMPDAVSSNYVREQFAESGFVNVKVGTFNALVEQLILLWMIPKSDSEFDALLRQSALALPKAFWYESLKVDERSTLRALTLSLIHIYNSLGLNDNFTKLNTSDDGSEQRIFRYYNDLCSLAEAMQFTRPLEQVQCRSWLDSSQLASIEPLTFIHSPELFEFNTWQKQVVDALSVHSLAVSVTSQLRAVVENASRDVHCESPDLQHLAAVLFTSSIEYPAQAPENTFFLKCRDALEECEVAVSRVQLALREGVNPKDIAVILPSFSQHQRLLPSLMTKAGIPCSNLANTHQYFEWDGQLLRDLIQLYSVALDDEEYLQPIMLGSVLVNPLMPWSLRYGQYLFEKYQQHGNFEFLNEKIKEQTDKLLELLLLNNVLPLEEWLVSICESLSYPKFPAAFTSAEMQRKADEALEIYRSYSDISELERCHALLNQLQPQSWKVADTEAAWLLNSVLVLTENDTLLRPVKHSFLLGFNQGSYQARLQTVGVFQKDGWKQLADETGLNLYQPLIEDLGFEMRMKRLVSATKQSLNLSFAAQAFDGEKLEASESLLDFAIALQTPANVDQDILIDNITDEAITQPFLMRVSGLTVIEPPEQPVADDLQLRCDLLSIHFDKEGNQRPESPSSLDKMMVSPLAWLLDRQGIESKLWEPQGLPVSLLGTIAHKVFELFFTSAANASQESFDDIFDLAVKVEADFMTTKKWRMERKQLKQEVYGALLPFLRWCEQEGWQSHMQEGKLTGELFGLPIKGFVDAVFKQGDTRLILDYKKSSSTNFVDRLNNGFDLQTMIYRKLLEAAGKIPAGVHSGYFALNDRTLVLDAAINSTVTGLNQKSIKAPIQDQSIKAETAVKRRIEQLRNGFVELNTEGDSKHWANLGVSSAKYAIDDNFLVSKYLKPVQEV
jgi:hypothetical protein